MNLSSLPFTGWRLLTEPEIEGPLADELGRCCDAITVTGHRHARGREAVAAVGLDQERIVESQPAGVAGQRDRDDQAVRLPDNDTRPAPLLLVPPPIEKVDEPDLAGVSSILRQSSIISDGLPYPPCIPSPCIPRGPPDRGSPASDDGWQPSVAIAPVDNAPPRPIPARPASHSTGRPPPIPGSYAQTGAWLSMNARPCSQRPAPPYRLYRALQTFGG